MNTVVFHCTVPGSRVLNSAAKEYFFDPLGFLELDAEVDKDIIDVLNAIAGTPGCPIYKHEGAKPKFESPVMEVPTGALAGMLNTTTKINAK